MDMYGNGSGVRARLSTPYKNSERSINHMTNKEIYTKTIGFSIRRILWDFVTLLIGVVLAVAGFLIADKLTDNGLIGLAIGMLAAIVLLVIAMRYISYMYKAGQIAMMTKAVTENSLPDDVIGEGKKIVKDRFATVAIFFAATGVIKGIFNQLGRAITSVGEKIGGENGSNIGAAISTIIQVIVAYLCDCCLGWVFYRRDTNAARATCEGAVLFFKNGKTFLKNMGRVFGMGLVSLVTIGGLFTGIFYGIFSAMPKAFDTLAAEITEIAAKADTHISPALTDPNNLMLVCALVVALLIWNFLHGAFIRPFILVGVLRNYMQAGIASSPTEESFELLESKSAKFAKLRKQI